jgi:hypothetical protein
MSKISAETAPQVETMEGFEGRYADLDGYTVGFESYTADDDPAPLFAGLPGDKCQAPHWGFVLEGKVGYRYADGTEEIINAGEAYYAPPGHTPLFFAGSRIVEFSPTDELAETVKVVLANVAAMEAS